MFSLIRVLLLAFVLELVSSMNSKLIVVILNMVSLNIRAVGHNMDFRIDNSWAMNNVCLEGFLRTYLYIIRGRD